MPSRAGSKNFKSQAAKQNTKDFFVRMLSDSAEETLWKRFLESEDEDIAFRAFLRAVEYKRGKPVQPVDQAESHTMFSLGVIEDGDSSATVN